MYKMHLKIVEGTEWDAAGELRDPRVRARASDRRNTVERETFNRLFSAKISIVLKYLLLKVNLRFKSQHAVWIFYESRNFKGITACNCLNINMRCFIGAFYRIKEWQWDVTVIKVNVFLLNITLTCWLTLSLCFIHLLLSLLLFTFLIEI